MFDAVSHVHVLPLAMRLQQRQVGIAAIEVNETRLVALLLLKVRQI
jgi:hypothetical protein